MNPILSRLVAFLGLLLIAYHSVNLWTSSGSAFHQDEYQHVHMAWNILNGKVLYTDFFDTHGPLSAWLFSFLLKMKSGDVASIASLFYLRKICLMFVYLSTILLFCSLQLWTKNLYLNIVSAALFIGQLTIQVTAFRIRPDIFMLNTALLFFILWMKNRRFWAGIFLGLSLGLNPKFIFFNLPILITDFFLQNNDDKKNFPPSPSRWKRFQNSKLALLAGEMLIFIGISFVHLIEGNWQESMTSQFLTNFRTVAIRIPHPESRFALLSGFLELDKTLLICFVIFILWIGYLFYRKRIPLQKNLVMILVLSVCGIGLLAAPLAHHGLMMAIPWFIILMTYVLNISFSKPLWGLTSFLALALITTYVSYTELPRYNSNLNPNFSSLSKALAEIPRSEPMLYIWPCRCPAYIFNSDSSKYWAQLVRTPEMDKGEVRNRFSNPLIRWAAVDDVMFSFLHPVEKEYLAEHFAKFDCLWHRK